MVHREPDIWTQWVNQLSQIESNQLKTCTSLISEQRLWLREKTTKTHSPQFRNVGTGEEVRVSVSESRVV